MARPQMATATAGATLTGGRLPEWTNGTVSKTVVVFRITMGSNPIPSATNHVAQIPVHNHTFRVSQQEVWVHAFCDLPYFLAFVLLVGFGFKVLA